MSNLQKRREVDKIKWLKRAKKVYNNNYEFIVPNEGVKNRTLDHKFNYRKVESITDFMENSIYAKFLKNTTVPYRNKMVKNENKYANRAKRHKNKINIRKFYSENDEINYMNLDINDYML